MRIGIIGGGPAGIAAAIWTKRLGLSPELFERTQRLGGQLHHISLPVSDIPGQIEVSAESLVMQLTRHLDAFSIPVRFNAQVVKVEEGFISCEDGSVAAVDRVLYAPGLRDRRLKIPGEAELLQPGTGALLANPPRGDVLVVGGGDRALEAACRLAEAGITVTLVHRHHQFRARMEFQERLAKTAAHILYDATLQSIVKESEGSRVVIRQHGEAMASRRFATVLIRIGMEPDLEPGVSSEDSRVILVGDAATSAPYRSVVEAYASGMRAAKSLVLGQDRLGPDLH